MINKINDSSHLKVFSLLFAGLLVIQSVLFIQIGSVSLFVFSCVVFLIVIMNAYHYEKRNRNLADHILNASFIFYSTGLCYKTGGIYSISIFMLFFIPLLTSVFSNKKEAILYLGTGFGIFLLFLIGQRFGIESVLSDNLVNISYFRIINLFAMFVFFTAAILLITTRNEKTKQLLEDSKQECKQINDNAHTAMKIKDEFLANMSHEIRNPMNGILGMMHVLLDSDLDEEQMKYSKIVYNSAKALLTIVNDILDLSKLEAGKLELDIRMFDLDVAIKDIVALPEIQARQKGIDFEYSIAQNVPCYLDGDIGRIRQIINNLTGNAIKFTDSGQVTLSVTLDSEDDDQAIVLFSVEDTGIGIKEEQIASLFESFTQADLSITKRFGGTGLGLTISKLFVEKMQGKIGVDSIDMIGSTFWFELPLKKAAEKERKLNFHTQNIDDCKILVITDGLSIGTNFENNLNALKLNYIRASDDTHALEMLKSANDDKQPFHVVLMEANESDITAENLGKEIRQDESLTNVQLILLTSIGKKGDAKRFEDAGFSAFLSKPVEQSLLLDCIKATLSRPYEPGSKNQPIITRFSIVESKKYNRRILIVDDMETNLLTAKALIGRYGYKVDEAVNGQQAVEKHKKNAYDLILMDCQMPVMDGYEATMRIREDEKALKLNYVPIVAMTGNAFASDQEKCFNAGMDDFIAKPVEPDVLMEKLSFNLADRVPTFKKRTLIKPEDEYKNLHAELESSQTDSGSQDTETDLCFNKKRLFERFGGDEELIEIILDSFYQEAPELIENISSAIEKNDFGVIRSNSHALKGSAANVNADLLRKAALAMETDAKNEISDSFASTFEIIQNEYNQFAREAKL